MVPEVSKIRAISRHSSKSRRPSPASSTTETDADEEFVPDALPDRLVHHQPETAAVLHRAAEAVCAPVRGRRQELADEVGAGEGLHAVETAFPAPLGGAGVVGHYPRDVVLVHLPRERPVERLAHRRRPDRREPRARVRLAAPSDMAYLAHEVRAVDMDALRKPPEVLDDPLVVQVQVGEVPLGIGRDVRRASEHRERDPAPRLGLVIELVALRRHPVHREAACMARAHDAVPERNVLQPEGLKQGVGRNAALRHAGLWHLDDLPFESTRRPRSDRRSGYGFRAPGGTTQGRPPIRTARPARGRPSRAKWALDVHDGPELAAWLSIHRLP